MIDIGKCIVGRRRAKGLKQKDLARLAEMSPTQLCQVENGRISPTFRMVERVAAALETDVAGLVGGAEPVEAAAPAAPVVAAAGAAAGDYVAVRVIEPDAARALGQILDEERERDGLDAARGVASGCELALNRARMRYGGAGAALAEALRADLGLGTAPVADLVTALEFRGFRVYARRLTKAVGSVLFWNAARNAPVAVLNARNTGERNRYRLAYELGSACLYASEGRRLDESLSQHRFLTDFTAAFLMPGVTVREYVAATGLGLRDWTMGALVELKARFGVSAESFALRLEELGLIAAPLRLRLREELRARYAAHPEAMEPQPEVGEPCGARWRTMRGGGRGSPEGGGARPEGGRTA